MKITKTAVVQIGNSDNKLTQQEWAEFIRDIDIAIKSETDRVHFFGCSHGDAPYQNACWVFEIPAGSECGFGYSAEYVHKLQTLKNNLSHVRLKYRQDSVALTIGNTEFI